MTGYNTDWKKLRYVTQDAFHLLVVHREAEHQDIVMKGSHHMAEHWDKVNPVGRDNQDFELGMVGLKVVLGRRLLSPAVSGRNLRCGVASGSHTMYYYLYLYLEGGVGRCQA